MAATTTFVSAPNLKVTSTKASVQYTFSGSADRLELGLSSNGSSLDICSYIEIPRKNGTATLTLPSRSTLCNLFNSHPSDTEVQIVYILRYHDADGYHLTRLNRTLQAESSVMGPLITPTFRAVPVNPTSPDTWSNFSGLFVQNRSKAQITVEVVPQYGASIDYVEIGAGGKIYQASHVSGYDYTVTTDAISVQGLLIDVTAYDSRGFNVTQLPDRRREVIPYRTPQILPQTGFQEVQLYRCTSEGVASDEGTYLYVRAKRSFSPINDPESGDMLNRCGLLLYYKESTASEYEYITLIAYSDTTRIQIARVITELQFDATKSYDVYLRCRDYTGSDARWSTTIESSRVTMHLAAGGRAMGIGQFAPQENDKLGVGWETTFAAGFLGTHKPVEVVGDIRTFALTVGVGITPIYTTGSTTNVPSAYVASPGIIVRRLSTNENVAIILMRYNTGAIAISTRWNGEWVDWKYLTPA